MSDITVPVVLLQKVAQFIELAAKENESLKAQLSNKTASTKEVVKEVNKIPANLATDAAKALVTHGLLSAEFVTKKASELEKPESLVATLCKVAELMASKQTLGTAEVSATKKPQVVDRLAEARKNFAKSIGVR